MKTSTTTIHGDFEPSLPDRKLSLRPWNPDIWDRNIQLDIAMVKKIHWATSTDKVQRHKI